jgi:hypothetical protein
MAGGKMQQAEKHLPPSILQPKKRLRRLQKGISLTLIALQEPQGGHLMVGRGLVWMLGTEADYFIS